MNNYETVLILNGNLNETKIDVVIKKITDILTKEGKLKEIEKMGLRKLAYEIRKQKEAYYVVINYKTMLCKTVQYFCTPS